MSCGGLGAEGMGLSLATDCHSETNTKRSTITCTVTYIALSLVFRGNKLLDRPVLALIGSRNLRNQIKVTL